MKIGTRIAVFVALMISGWVWAGTADTNQTAERIWVYRDGPSI